MKNITFILLLSIAGMANVNAQQLPELKDAVRSFGINPLFTDSIAKWSPLKSLPLSKLRLNTDEQVYSNMPAVKPKGNYKTPVIDPTTSGLKYTMMVKRVGIVKPRIEDRDLNTIRPLELPDSN